MKTFYSIAFRGSRGVAARPIALAIFAVLALPVWPMLSRAQIEKEETALELSLANAYLYVASRTAWPEAPPERQTFAFCVNREHPLYETFARMLPKKKLAGMSVDIRSFDVADAASQRNCNVIALSSNDSINRAITKNVEGTPVLTISHETDNTTYGGILYLAHEKRLEPPKIDFDRLQASGLKIDAAVLDLSKKRWGENTH